MRIYHPGIGLPERVHAAPWWCMSMGHPRPGLCACRHNQYVQAQSIRAQRTTRDEHHLRCWELEESSLGRLLPSRPEHRLRCRPEHRLRLICRGLRSHGRLLRISIALILKVDAKRTHNREPKCTGRAQMATGHEKQGVLGPWSCTWEAGGRKSGRVGRTGGRGGETGREGISGPAARAGPQSSPSGT